MTAFLLTVGPFLVPLLLLSFYSVGLILAKAGEFRRARPLRPEVLDRLTAGVLASAPDTAGLPGDHPAVRLLSYAGEPPAVLQSRAQQLLGRLEDRLSYLPALANIATLTGLFGTVCGMIAAFLALRSQGGADPSALAGGLGQALVATALGLVAAIPSLAAHAVFHKRLLVLTSQLELLLSALLPGPAEAGRG